MDKSVALKSALQIALMAFLHNTANAGPSWDFNLEHTITAPHGSYQLPGAINTFGTEQRHIRVNKKLFVVLSWLFDVECLCYATHGTIQFHVRFYSSEPSFCVGVQGRSVSEISGEGRCKEYGPCGWGAAWNLMGTNILNMAMLKIFKTK